MRENTWEKARDLDRRLPDRVRLTLTRYRRGGRWTGALRRAIAAVLLIAAGALTLLPEQAPAADHRIVAVTRDLPVGAILTRGDITLIDVATPPDGAIRTGSDALGRALGAPVRRGELLTDLRLAADTMPDAGPGRVAVPISLPDPAIVDLLRPGVHVTVVSLGADTSMDGGAGSTAIAVASDAVILAIVEPADTGLTAAHPRTVLLGVDATEADRVMGAAAAGTVALRFE